MSMKLGQVERTDDSAFRSESERFKQLQTNSNALQKEAKAYLDAVRNVSASSTRIGMTIDMFFGSDSGEQAISANAYKRAVEELEGDIARTIDAPYRATVLEPIGKFCAHLPEVANAISKREKKLLDYDAARSKARKLGEKDDAIKLRAAEQEEEQAREIFQALDGQLREELPQLLDLRIPYLDPSFECMVRLQAHFATDGYEKLGGVQRYFADGVRDEYASGALDAQVEGALQEMRELSICGLSAPSPASLALALLACSDLRLLCVLRESLRDARRMRARLPFLARLAVHPSSPSPATAAPLCGPSRAASTSAAVLPSYVPPIQQQHTRKGPTSDARESALERALADNFLRSDAGLAGGGSEAPRASSGPLQADKRVRRVPDGAGRRSDRPVPSSKEASAAASLAEARRPAGQAAGSTDKKPTPRRRTRPTTPPEPVWPPSTSLHDALLQQCLPTSSDELLQFLRRVKTVYVHPDLEALADFHASDAIAHFVSTDSYRFLLKLAFDASNLRLARALLSEMEEKEVAMDEPTQRVVVQGYLARGELGPEDERRKQAAIRALRVNPSMAPQVFRRDLGEKGAGSGDPMERWKGWSITSRHRREMRELRELRAQQEEELRRGVEKEAVLRSPPHLRSRRERHATPLARPQARVPPRPPLIIPRDAHRLDRYAVTALVHRLVREDRVSDGFALARSWLSANKPRLDSETSAAYSRTTSDPQTQTRSDDTHSHVRQYLQHSTLYHKTSRILMNILLKALFAERSPRPVIRDFITNFLTTYSADPPAPDNLPEVSTLRLLVSGLRGATNAWVRAASYVDWFGYRWGMPKADPSDRAWYHVVPPSRESAVGLGLADKDGKPLGPFAKKPKDSRLLPLAPHRLVTPDVAILMLRHAVESAKKRNVGSATKRAINEWWHGLDKRGSEIWRTYEAKGLVYRAIKAGLIVEEEKVEGRAKKAAAAKASGGSKKETKTP
ncbi:Hob3p [Rhodotorula toruloides ATCC 204091]|nr:Hob3p [Rhodotorula toruloides ATCC 204091]PRQ77447.1 hypothetical protein AAT19DRAFT_8515 [Rhodotorula toruloides]